MTKVIKHKLKFEHKLIILGTIMAALPLIISYLIFTSKQLRYQDERIRANLQAAAASVAQAPLVKEKLALRQNDLALQQYTERLIESFQDVDLIVIADMNGVKYTHPDETQIGDIFIGMDKQEVLATGASYYSLNEGSLGMTLRWFEPIYNGQQVGFVMVGKYYNEIYDMLKQTKIHYLMVFLPLFIVSIIFAKIFAKHVKRAILNMEPEQISELYIQKNIIINSVQEGIIAIDIEGNISEMNENAEKLFSHFTQKEFLQKLEQELVIREPIRLKEIMLKGKRLFINAQPIIEKGRYIGTVITLLDEQDINRVAKEITGVEELVKNLRATIHEFKNNIHVILGLLQLEEYDEAKRYIMQIQEAKRLQEVAFNTIEDYYIRALLMSRAIVANERQVEFNLTKDSYLAANHKYIDSNDLVTIIGNLIENAMEACSLSREKKSYVIVYLSEDEENIKIEVKDNGVPINQEIEHKLFDIGVSTKGDGRGTGLYLVKGRVAIYNGKISIIKQDNEKTFRVVIPKGEVKDGTCANS